MDNEGGKIRRPGTQKTITVVFYVPVDLLCATHMLVKFGASRSTDRFVGMGRVGRQDDRKVERDEDDGYFAIPMNRHHIYMIRP
jgi:hypothetical protein